ncbi:diaminopimelate epimerase [Acidobacteriota bacterium]
MKLQFTKLQGCGNDFVLIDEDLNPGLKEKDRKRLSKILRDRHFSIGADSVLFTHTEDNNAIFRTMEDGIDLDMCGTGARCVAHYYREKTGQKSLNVVTINGTALHVTLEGDLYKVGMGRLHPVQKYLGLKTQDRLVIKANELFRPVEKDLLPLDSGIDLRKGYFLNTDEAHLVFFVDDVEHIDLDRVGKFFAFQKDVFPDTTNVSVGQFVEATSIRLRTYERASFHETLACGTGSLAAAWAARQEFNLKADKIRVISKGGEQFVLFENEDLFLIGPAESVYSGVIDIMPED